MALAFVDDLFLSVTARPSVPSFFLGVLCRLHNLAVQRCGSGFEEPHLRLMFWLGGIGVFMKFP